MKHLRFIWLAAVAIMMAACGHDNPEPSDVLVGKGVFVLNEGTFTYANASLTWYDPEADTVANNLFYRVNGSPIGDVGESLCLLNGYLYIVVNSSNYIYKVNAGSIYCDTLQPYILTDFYSPRHMWPVAPNKAYVSDLEGSGLWIIDPVTMTHTGSVEMGKPTENIVQVGNELYVNNWSNFYMNTVENNTVQVVDINSDTKVAEIEVGKEPNSLVVDKNGKVWTLCSGGYDGMHMPVLCCIDPMTKQVVKRFEFPAGYPTCYPGYLNINKTGETLYFINKDVYSMSIDSDALPTTPFITAEEGVMFYNMKVNPENGEIYVTDAKNYTQNGQVFRYTSDGVKLSVFSAGICPSSILFN